MKTTAQPTLFAPRASRSLALAALTIAALAAMSACTTTVQRVPEMQPVSRNSTPSSMSETRVAATALEGGNIELARTLYGKVVEANPNSVPGLAGLGDTLYAVGDFTRAGVYYSRTNKIDPNAEPPLIGLGRVAIRQRRFDDAIASYRAILDRTPNDSLAAAGLGTALDLKGDHNAAQDALRAGLVQNPGDPMLCINLGLSLVLGGNPREGANVLLDVTRFPDAPPQAREDLALAYGMLGNKEAATAILSKDLPKASVQDNLRYYDMERSALVQPMSSSPVSDSNTAHTAAVAPAAIQASRLP
jgi:Flp pilus assembly protein TadD